jgi:hypothetical protein
MKLASLWPGHTGCLPSSVPSWATDPRRRSIDASIITQNRRKAKEMQQSQHGCCKVKEGTPPGATGRFAPPFPNGRRARSSILLGTLSSSENATAVANPGQPPTNLKPAAPLLAWDRQIPRSWRRIWQFTVRDRAQLCDSAAAQPASQQSLAGPCHFGYNSDAYFRSSGGEPFRKLPDPTRKPLLEGKHEVRR